MNVVLSYICIGLILKLLVYCACMCFHLVSKLFVYCVCMCCCYLVPKHVASTMCVCFYLVSKLFVYCVRMCFFLCLNMLSNQCVHVCVCLNMLPQQCVHAFLLGASTLYTCTLCFSLEFNAELRH